MDDQEAVRLCAEAMGLFKLPEYGLGNDGYPLNHATETVYDPLTNGEQCLALVERFDMVIEREKDNSFGVTLFGNERKGGHPTFVIRNEPNLRRAIVHCVAKQRAAKK